MWFEYNRSLVIRLSGSVSCRFLQTVPKLEAVKMLVLISEGDTPPPFWYAVFSFLDGTQYAKGRYAVHVRRNSVISYADIIFYF